MTLRHRVQGSGKCVGGGGRVRQCGYVAHLYINIVCREAAGKTQCVNACT